MELSPDGKARLIPVCIMIDGKFYDAGAYKASPVPLALWTDTVYEGEKSGVPQGLFTVAEAGHVGNENWFGVGKWVPAGSGAKARQKKGSDAKPKLDEDEGPPKLRRSEPAKPPDSGASPPNQPVSAQQGSQSPPPAAATAPGSTAPKSASGPPQPSATAAAGEHKPEGSASAISNDEDPDRPVLRRGKTETEGEEHPQVGASTGVPRRPANPAAAREARKAPSQLLPAISDAGGPDPRPYTYDLKAAEEQKYRKGMLALAADAVTAKLRQTTPAVAPATTAARKPAHRPAPKGPQPTFDDVQFRAFDLWNTNEPVFVLSAKVKVPATAGAGESPDQNYYITIVAKNDIYDELRRLYAGVTDARDLDVTPRLELIDAVDADGDGRGELLFRTTSDAGKAWAVYRAGADQLIPLFEGTPPETKPPSE